MQHRLWWCLNHTRMAGCPLATKATTYSVSPHIHNSSQDFHIGPRHQRTTVPAHRRATIPSVTQRAGAKRHHVLGNRLHRGEAPSLQLFGSGIDDIGVIRKPKQSAKGQQPRTNSDTAKGFLQQQSEMYNNKNESHTLSVAPVTQLCITPSTIQSAIRAQFEYHQLQRATPPHMAND